MSNTKTLLGFIAGAATGALIGILFAPDEGAKTRKKITGKAGDISDSLKTAFNDFVEGIKDAYADTKEDAAEIEEKATAKMNSLKADAQARLS